MTIDKDSNEFKDFSDELKQKLNTRLYDKITTSRKDVASGMVGQSPDTPPTDNRDNNLPEE